MDKSWMRADRLSLEYELGVEEFLTVALGRNSLDTVISCPCVKCNNGKSFPASVVKDHLFWSGIDETYETWIWHGEVESSGDASSGSDSEYESVEGAEPNVEVGGGMDEVEDEEFSPDSSDFLKFVTDGDKPLYTGSNRTKLKAIVESYNLKVRYGMSDTCYNDMLHMVSEWLPEGNVLPKTTYQAKKSLSSLGMEYTKIHACPNDCILYREHNADANSCPTCGMSRWKLNKDDKDRVGVPAKVLWYFPPIPRFKRMFQSTSSAKSLTWHSQHREKLNHTWKVHQWKNLLGMPAQGSKPVLCGYFVMRYMKDIVEDTSLGFFKKWDRKGDHVYTQEHFDEVRQQWAQYFSDNFI